MKVNESRENYLKALRILLKEKQNVRAVDLADYMNFSKASISIALKKLSKVGYVFINEDGNLMLTDLGNQLAEKVSECHCYFEQLLLDVGVSKEQAHMDACMIEHTISGESYKALHIHKIFDRNGRIAMFEELIKINCFSEDAKERQKAADELEHLYGCEIYCTEIDPGVCFAHHARGCTIIAAKICKGVVIYQNVTMGSNMKYNKVQQRWENVGSPIIAENVIVCDGAKILGPVVIGENSVVAAGAIVTINIPANSVVYGVNQYRPKDESYDLVYNNHSPSGEDIAETDKKLIEKFNQRSI